jgi:hypothetical protein
MTEWMGVTLDHNCSTDLAGYLDGSYSRLNFEHRWINHKCPLPIPPVRGSDGGGDAGSGTGAGDGAGTVGMLFAPVLPVIGSHNFVKGEDPVAIIKVSELRFAPPSIRSAGNQYTWPLGIEGFRRSGSATLGIHKYLGDGNVAVQVMHLDEAHIEMTGTFPGLSSTTNMEQLLAVITADGSKDLFLPGVFTKIQRVFTENYDFSHAIDDRTHSIDYNISFVRTTVGATVPGSTINTAGGVAFAAQAIPSTPRNTTISIQGQSQNVYTVAGGPMSLRDISTVVYGGQGNWRKLIDLNKDTLEIYNPDGSLIRYQLPTTRLPIGTKIVF